MLRALQTSQLQAETDGLTGLLNRRSLEARAATLLQPDNVVSVAMADLDHFKRLNDTYGHAAGDRALRLFAQVLRTTVRPGDIVARCGGEEFVILLPSCPLTDAVEVLERVRDALSRSTGRGDCPAFTASFGVATYPDFGHTLAELLTVADTALYEAKSEGRDRIVAAGRGEAAPLPGTPVPLVRARG
jgi:diguanylate cyclase (GGDEF)-like protein